MRDGSLITGTVLTDTKSYSQISPAKSRSRMIGRYDDCIALKFDRHLSSGAVDQILERLERFKLESRSFEPSDLVKTSVRLAAEWKEYSSNN